MTKSGKKFDPGVLLWVIAILLLGGAAYEIMLFLEATQQTMSDWINNISVGNVKTALGIQTDPSDNAQTQMDIPTQDNSELAEDYQVGPNENNALALLSSPVDNQKFSDFWTNLTGAEQQALYNNWGGTGKNTRDWICWPISVPSSGIYLGHAMDLFSVMRCALNDATLKACQADWCSKNDCSIIPFT